MDIDFVVTWVDPSDPAWILSRDKYASESTEDGDRDIERYRDWELFRYWFRSVEKFCPWIRRVHLITSGHVPTWLELSNPKLHVVRHEEYLESKYLPTFNSQVIENSMHLIPELSEHFVYFNDDMYCLRPMKPELFFREGKPAGNSSPAQLWNGDYLSHVLLNDLSLINRHFSKRGVIKANWKYFLSPRYGIRSLIRSCCEMPWNRFGAFLIHHGAQPYLKSTFQEVWELEHEALSATNYSRFRALSDLNHYVFYYWQLCSGNFAPVGAEKLGAVRKIGVDSIHELSAHVRESVSNIICLNDGPTTTFESDKRELLQAFGALLPEPCSFERV